MSAPTIHDVSKDLTMLKEQMNTHQAKCEGALERFHADMAQRESTRLQWLIGVWIGGVLVTIALLGIFIRLSI